jgi:hypothetical protein
MTPPPARSSKRSREGSFSGASPACSGGSQEAPWRKVVRSWKTPVEASRWFSARDIDDLKASDAAWLRSKESDCKLKAHEAGAGRSLYRAIVSDARFCGDFRKFQVWLQPWRDFSFVVSMWQRPDDAIAWAKAHELPARKLVDTRWLRKVPVLADREGFKGLYSAICDDPRFVGDFAKFSSWFKRGSSDSAVVSSWQSREDVLTWAVRNGVDLRCLSDETAFRSARRRIHRAILNDSRFSGSYKKFKAWLDIRADLNPVVSSWSDQADAVNWGELNGLSPEDLGSPETLTGKGLVHIVEGVLSDPRFGGDFSTFRKWLRVNSSSAALVRSWKSKQDALDWAASAGVSWEFLNATVLPLGQALEGVRKAILEDPRFKGEIAQFRIWLCLEPDFHSLVRGWVAPKDALAWASSRGVSESNLVRRSWLISTSVLPPTQGGIGESLEGLVKAICIDPRFDGDFSKFRKWLGLTNWRTVIQSWKTPRDAHLWAAARGMSWATIADVKSTPRNSAEGTELVALTQAIVSDPRFIEGLPEFLRWLDGSE